MKIVRAIKNGWIKPKPVPEQPSFYMLWSDTQQVGGAYTWYTVLYALDKLHPPRGYCIYTRQLIN